MMDESFIVGVAFFVFLFVAYRMLRNILPNMLDSRAARIEKELSEAVRLREEAQILLSDYEKRCREIETEAKEMLAKAQQTAETMRLEAETHLKKAIEARLATAHAKIARAEAQALQGVQKQAVDVALEAAKQVIREKMKQDANDSLIKLALKDADRVIH